MDRSPAGKTKTGIPDCLGVMAVIGYSGFLFLCFRSFVRPFSGWLHPSVFSWQFSGHSFPVVLLTPFFFVRSFPAVLPFYSNQVVFVLRFCTLVFSRQFSYSCFRPPVFRPLLSCCSCPVFDLVSLISSEALFLSSIHRGQ